MNLSRSLLLVLTALLLSACGFELRGTGGGSALPEDWRQMHLISQSPNSEFTRVLESTFAASGVNWVEREAATHVLRLGPEQFAQSNLSVNAQARAAEFDLQMKASFVVLDADGRGIMPSTTANFRELLQNRRSPKPKIRGEVTRISKRRSGFRDRTRDVLRRAMAQFE